MMEVHCPSDLVGHLRSNTRWTCLGKHGTMLNKMHQFARIQAGSSMLGSEVMRKGCVLSSDGTSADAIPPWVTPRSFRQLLQSAAEKHHKGH